MPESRELSSPDGMVRPGFSRPIAEGGWRDWGDVPVGLTSRTRLGICPLGVYTMVGGCTPWWRCHLPVSNVTRRPRLHRMVSPYDGVEPFDRSGAVVCSTVHAVKAGRRQSAHRMAPMRSACRVRLGPGSSGDVPSGLPKTFESLLPPHHFFGVEVQLSLDD